MSALVAKVISPVSFPVLTVKVPKAPFVLEPLVAVPIAPLKVVVPLPPSIVRLLPASAVESSAPEKSIVPLPLSNVISASTTTAPLRSIEAASSSVVAAFVCGSSAVVIFPFNLIVGAVITTSFISVDMAPTVAVPPVAPV